MPGDLLGLWSYHSGLAIGDGIHWQHFILDGLDKKVSACGHFRSGTTLLTLLEVREFMDHLTQLFRIHPLDKLLLLRSGRF